jgi:urease beta subunit
MIPGEIVARDGELESTAGVRTIVAAVANTGDLRIQVGLHYHSPRPTMPAFDRAAARLPPQHRGGHGSSLSPGKSAQWSS